MGTAGTVSVSTVICELEAGAGAEAFLGLTTGSDSTAGVEVPELEADGGGGRVVGSEGDETEAIPGKLDAVVVMEEVLVRDSPVEAPGVEL